MCTAAGAGGGGAAMVMNFQELLLPKHPSCSQTSGNTGALLEGNRHVAIGVRGAGDQELRVSC